MTAQAIRDSIVSGVAKAEYAEEALAQGIVNALYGAFDDACTYYRDTVPQNFAVPSFLIRQISGSGDRLLGPRGRLRRVYEVIFFPASYDHGKGEAAEMNAALMKLYDALETITLPEAQGGDGLPLRWAEISHRIEDHALHMELRYEAFVLRVKEQAPMMETLIQNQRLKNGNEDSSQDESESADESGE